MNSKIYLIVNNQKITATKVIKKYLFSVNYVGVNLGAA